MVGTSIEIVVTSPERKCAFAIVLAQRKSISIIRMASILYFFFSLIINSPPLCNQPSPYKSEDTKFDHIPAEIFVQKHQYYNAIFNTLLLLLPTPFSLIIPPPAPL